MIEFIEYNWIELLQLIIAYSLGIGCGYYYRKSKEIKK